LQVLKQQEVDVRDKVKAESSVAIESVISLKESEILKLRA